MPYRFTDTDKWGDSWFFNLKPIEKLLFNYLCDNCDIAGFIEINIRKWASDIGDNENTIEGALKGLQRGLIYSKLFDCIFLRNFLKHQKNLPLNIRNKAHLGIIYRFKLYSEKFDIQDINEFIEGASKGLQSPSGIGIGIGIGNKIPKPEKEKSCAKKEKFQNVFSKEETNKSWAQLLQMKKWAKKEDSAIQKSIDKLKEFDEDFAKELIDKAIAGEYQGVVFTNTNEEYQKWKNGTNRKNNTTITRTERIHNGYEFTKPVTRDDF